MQRSGMQHLDLRYLTGHSTTDIMNCYISLEPDRAMSAYFVAIKPLLDAIQRRAAVLGIATSATGDKGGKKSVSPSDERV